DPAWSLDTGTPIEIGEPGGQATVHFSFRPTHAGTSRATLVIASNDGLNPETRVPIAANGRELPPCVLEVSPGTMFDLGATRLFNPSVQGVELTNTTGWDCIVGEPVITSGGPAFRWPGGNPPSGRELPPGGRMSVRVEFVPQEAISYSGSMRFYVSNQAAPAATIALTGRGDDSCFFLT